MKNFKIQISVSIILLSLSSLISQNSISLITGIHQSNIKANGVNFNFLDFKPITRMHGGLLFERAIDKNFSARTGIVYSEKGFRIKESLGVDVFGMQFPVGVTIETEIKTIDIPLTVKYDLVTNNSIIPYLSAGLNFSYASHANIKTKANSLFDFTISNSTIDLSGPAFNRWTAEVNLSVGMKLEKGNGFYLAELGYAHSLNDFTNENSTIIDAGIRNYSLSLSVGYGIRF